MNNKTTRVLGRVLAMEEVRTVSGAKQTAPCRDFITAPNSDTNGCEISSAHFLKIDNSSESTAGIYKTKI